MEIKLDLSIYYKNGAVKYIKEVEELKFSADKLVTIGATGEEIVRVSPVDIIKIKVKGA